MTDNASTPPDWGKHAAVAKFAREQLDDQIVQLKHAATAEIMTALFHEAEGLLRGLELSGIIADWEIGQFRYNLAEAHNAVQTRLATGAQRETTDDPEVDQ